MQQQYSIQEEIANALTHGVGIIFGIVAIPVLLAFSVVSHNLPLTAATAIYGFGMLCMFTFSTLYHAIQAVEVKKVLRIFDHISIFLLIGGTYTPIVLKSVPTSTAIWFLAVQWSLIAAGIVLKVFFTGRFRLVSSLLYLGLGWMVVFIGRPVWETLTAWSLTWLVIGGIIYSIGVIFYQVRKIPYNHAIWHIFVLAATIAHYIAMLDIIQI